MIMSTKNEVLNDLSAKDYGVKSRFYIDESRQSDECTVVKPFDREKFEAYKAAHPEEFSPEVMRANKKRLGSKIRNDRKICGV